MDRILSLKRSTGKLLAMALAALVFFVDIYTGNEIRVYPFYFMAIMLAALVATRAQTLLFAGSCALLWLASKYLDQTPFSTPAVWLWNGSAQAVSFLGVGYLVHRLIAAIAAVADAERISRHDLKTPLSSIVAATELMQARNRLEGEDARLLAAVKHAARRAIAMVNLSLHLHHMEEGRFVFVSQPVDLLAILDEAVADLAAHAATKSVSVHVEGRGKPALVAAQPELCYSLLANLLRNAIQAAPEGSQVTVSLAREAGRQHLAIANRGAVPQQIRDRFFEKYVTFGKPDGTGLGAYSARLIAEAMGGRLRMSTDDFRGTRLDLELEVDDAFSHQAARPTQALLLAGGRRRILVVDNDEFNRLILAHLLPMDGEPADMAANGRIALDIVRRRRPDLIFLDINMPVMGGIEALQAIRRYQAEAGQPPSTIIAYSALDDPQSRARYLAQGFDAVLAKPCSRRELIELLGTPAEDCAIPAVPTVEEGVVVDADLLPLIPEFRRSRNALLLELVAALEQGRREDARGIVHQLAGSLGAYGFTSLGNACKKIEQAAMEGELDCLVKMARDVQARFDRTQVRGV